MPRDMERWRQPASDAFRIAVVTAGAVRLRGSGGEKRSWVTNAVTGAACKTPPGRTLTLSWTALAPGPVGMAQLALPVGLITRFAEEELDGRRRSVQELGAMPKPDPVIASMTGALLRARLAGAHDLYASSAAQYLAAHLVMSEPRRVVPAAHGAAMGSRRLAAVTDYMNEHLAESITLDELAQQAGLSRFHFIRLFTAATGSSPYRFLTDLRMDRARRWLDRSNEPVAVIGRRCGYKNAGHFATAFRRQFGCSPTQYRQEVRLSAHRAAPGDTQAGGDTELLTSAGPK
ncbi:helix-turn-helix domain-containing protein [Streptomyces sp. NPDC085946]|uniref:helix-turn-helix domain-containing protein n=1 Tax=Streptomyces sp. NPDC085946 TaxID=3365744 RepID=UPI0037D69BCC